MATIVGIQFQKNGKVYNYDANDLELRQNEYVIVDTPHGIDLGQVVADNRTEETEAKVPLKKVIRIATEKDLQVSTENRQKEHGYKSYSGDCHKDSSECAHQC